MCIRLLADSTEAFKRAYVERIVEEVEDRFRVGEEESQKRC